MMDVAGGASFCGKWSKELIGPLSPSGNGVVTGLHLEKQELVKFVSLAYFVKNKSLFPTALPGHQVTGDKRGGEVDDTKQWIEAIKERTAEKFKVCKARSA